MSDGKSWWNILSPWLNAVRLSADGVLWTGFDSLESRTDLERSEGPIYVRSVSWGERPLFRRTLASCAEYVLDIASLSGVLVHTMEWSVKTSLLHPIQPPALPLTGAPLPLEARWIMEWRTPSGLKVRTSGESGRGTLAEWRSQSDPHSERWSVQRRGTDEFFTACHEPAERPRVQATFTLSQKGQFTVRVTGDGFFDYWMLDPAHTPSPLQINGETMEIGAGWGFVRLERGKEAAYGALRRDWG
jgi:hypothetical protein